MASSARNCDGRRLKTEVGRVPYAFTFRHFARWSSVKEMALVISVYNTKYNFQTAEVFNIVITFYCILYINITMVSVVYISHICTAQFTLQCKYSIGFKVSLTQLICTSDMQSRKFYFYCFFMKICQYMKEKAGLVLNSRFCNV